MNAEGPLRLTVSSHGKLLCEALQIISVTVHRAINQVPGMTMVLADGDMPSQTFPVSDSEDFAPGAEVVVQSGYGDNEAVIFQGIVVRHGLTVSGDNDARLVVECRDAAVKMTVGCKSAIFEDQTDSAVMQRRIGDTGLVADVARTTHMHRGLVQHHCTDWNFLVARAEANGYVVVATDGTVKVGPPDLGSEPALLITYGTDLQEFKADVDARHTCGRLKFRGSALAKVGGLIELAGVGKRFNGKVFVTGLTHRIHDGVWRTEAEFGPPPAPMTDPTIAESAPASRRVPGVAGLYAGIVLKQEADPEGQHRVQVEVPSAGIGRVWARLLQFHASNAFGAMFVPELGDEVLLGWFHNDPDCPVILGSLYSSKHTPPFTLEAANRTKGIVTRCKARLEFDDEDKVITLSTPAGNRVVLSDKNKCIVIDDQNGNKVELNSKGITLDSPKDICIRAKGAITLEAVNAVTIQSQADVSTEGLNVNCTAQVGFVAKGSASAELSATGQTTVRGAMVMIN
jgi:uncharacterized protein involved in type VI secretion and phage assembly